MKILKLLAAIFPKKECNIDINCISDHLKKDIGLL